MSHIVDVLPFLEELDSLFNQKKFDQARQLCSSFFSNYSDFYALQYQWELKLLQAEIGSAALLAQVNGQASSVDKYLALGVIHLNDKDTQKALLAFSEGLELSQNHPLLCHFAGQACFDKGLFKESLQLATAPADGMLKESNLLCALAYFNMQDYERAYIAYEKAFTSLPSDQNFFSLLLFMRDRIRLDKLLHWGYVQRSRVLLSEYGPALTSYQKEVKTLEGNLASLTGDNAKAIRIYGDLHKLYPSDEGIKNDLAYTLMAEGAFKEAFNLRPNREFDFKTLDKFDGVDSTPDWNGENLNKKALIVFCEQGLGDKILLLRFINKLQQKYKLSDIVVVVEERLLPILERSDFGKARFITTSANTLKLTGFDYKTFLSDLLFLLGPSSPPKQGSGAYLTVDREKSTYFKDKYQKLFPGKVTIGVTWKSISQISGSSKDLVLREMGALLNIKGVQWISLQYGDIDADLTSFVEEHDSTVYVDPEVNHVTDIDTSLSQIEALDYVVSISNATAHLAGSIGKSGTVLVPRRPLWHWLTYGETSCWYQSLQLIRQHGFNTWRNQLQDVREIICTKFPKLEVISLPTLGEIKALFYTSQFNSLIERLSKFRVEELPPQHKTFLADTYLKLGEVNNAVALVHPMMQQGLTTDHNMLLMAKAGRVLGQIKETEVLLNSIKDPQFSLEVMLEKLTRALDEQDVNLATNLWNQVISFSPSISTVDQISTFLFVQREWITTKSYIEPERLAFCWRMVKDYEAFFGSHNPVVSIILTAELKSYEGDIKSAISGFRKAFELRPELTAQMNASLGYCLLSDGQLKEGFERHFRIREVEKRMVSEDAVDYNLPIADPEKLLPSLNENIVITCEQGIGDQILSLEFLKILLSRYKGKVALTIAPKLLSIIKRSFPEMQFVNAENANYDPAILKGFKYKLPMGDIPRLMMDEFDHFKAELPVLVPDPEKVEYYKTRLANMFPGKKLIGLSWRSVGGLWGSSKDVALTSFTGLIDNPDYQCVSIQYLNPKVDVDQFNATHQGGSIFLDETVDFTNDLDSVNAFIAALDFVVTISNVNAHFTGAMNKPGLVVLKQRAIWHWQSNSETVPWYPSLKLIRQKNFETELGLSEKILLEVEANLNVSEVAC